MQWFNLYLSAGLFVMLVALFMRIRVEEKNRPHVCGEAIKDFFAILLFVVVWPLSLCFCLFDRGDDHVR